MSITTNSSFSHTMYMYLPPSSDPMLIQPRWPKNECANAEEYQTNVKLRAWVLITNMSLTFSSAVAVHSIQATFLTARVYFGIFIL
jgi:hypothetical protein